MKDIYTPNEVARLFMVSPITVRQWAQKGLLRAQLTAGGHRRFLRKDLEAFARERGLNLYEDDGRCRPGILVIDDDEYTFRLLSEGLAKADVGEIIWESDGFSAGCRLVSCRPGMVMIEMMIPGMDCFNICDKIRSDPSLAGTRLIAMSSDPHQEMRSRILGCGVDAILNKPFTLEAARDVILRLRERPPARQAVPST